MRYFLGADLGSTKTHMALATESGQVVGFARTGPGNHQSVGFDGMLATLRDGLAQVVAQAGIPAMAVAGAGFGIAGYDWPSLEEPLSRVIGQLELTCPVGMVNDAVPGILAGARDGWGVGLVSGTGCNCRGWDRAHRREGRVTGYGYRMGEFAGASELLWRAMQLVSFAWTQRGPATKLTAALVAVAGVSDVDALLEAYTEGHLSIDAQAAKVIFEVARQGDAVARELIHWAGTELGEMANAVIRQLDIADQAFDVVLAGSMFDGGPLLIEPLRATVTALAPRARLVRLTLPPVIGAVILGMEQAAVVATAAVRAALAESMGAVAAL